MDFGWIVSEVPASVAGVYTTNKVIAAPLLVTKEAVEKSQKMRAVVVNSGCANSCTGQQGLEDAYTMQKWTAEKLGVAPERCLVFEDADAGLKAAAAAGMAAIDVRNLWPVQRPLQ